MFCSKTKTSSSRDNNAASFIFNRSDKFDILTSDSNLSFSIFFSAKSSIALLSSISIAVDFASLLFSSKSQLYAMAFVSTLLRSSFRAKIEESDTALKSVSSACLSITLHSSCEILSSRVFLDSSERQRKASFSKVNVCNFDCFSTILSFNFIASSSNKDFVEVSTLIFALDSSALSSSLAFSLDNLSISACVKRLLRWDSNNRFSVDSLSATIDSILACAAFASVQ
mmetsp:Transcript_22071/g.25341  ORF Transcript_22071/g.25341 Transcript_22071/m.25341 type:complete len:227 (-) Transcript_22071:118-798(-)